MDAPFAHPENDDDDARVWALLDSLGHTTPACGAWSRDSECPHVVCSCGTEVTLP